MKQQNNQIDQKKGSADCDVTGSKKGMPGGEIGRNSMGTGSSQNAASYGGYESSYGSAAGSGSATRSTTGSTSAGNAMTGKSDYGGPEGNSRARKTSRNGSDSNES